MDGGCFVGDQHIQIGRPLKLNLEQPILKFILYMEHDNVSVCDVFLWNWSKIIICDATILITFYINDVINNCLTIQMFCAFFSLQIMETLCFCDQCNLSWA